MNTISKFIFWIYEFLGKAWNVFNFLIPTKVNNAAIKPQNNWCFKKWGVAAKLPTTNLTQISSWNQDNMLSSAVFMWLPTSLLILFWLSCRSFWKKASPGLHPPTVKGSGVPERIEWNNSTYISCLSNSSRPHGLQPTRLLHPWDSACKSTGVGCHCLLCFLSTSWYNLYIWDWS